MVDFEKIRVFAPSSLSNLGPGFDTLGLAITGIGDEVTAWRTETGGVQVEFDPDGLAVPLPADPAQNTAARAAQIVLEQAGADFGVVLRLRKGIPLGSGIGGSASSAVAGAWAANALLDRPFQKADLVEAVLDGESLASGSRHGDNVLPSLFGGVVLVDPDSPARYRQIEVPALPAIALLLPSIQILTHEARAILPTEVPLRDAVRHAAALAFLLDAIREGDWEAAGCYLMRDRLVEPHRARLVGGYDAVRAAALDAGGLGCALSGSGPALFALVRPGVDPDRVLDAMRAASRAAGVASDGWITRLDVEGVRVIS